MNDHQRDQQLLDVLQAALDVGLAELDAGLGVETSPGPGLRGQDLNLRRPGYEPLGNSWNGAPTLPA